ncbi:IS66-like element accessory protein TnpA [Sphingosinicella microcystinivorans]|uniref:IS66-like element accessory protein TnpA n=1 Tax=Sphingosinicella microcystinivorans TaxID=335406 RepID=UPI0022F39173|nr:transposase [Sphingosinicella microcystinivorans]WBX86216.1 transposase [Sphingosinicella microcystinivorans]
MKRFGNWRDRFKAEEKVHQAGLLYRRGGLSHMSSHMTDRENGPLSTGYVPSGRALPESRRNFRLSDKKRIVAEAMAPGASVSSVARRYGIAPRVLFRWKQGLVPSEPEPVFLPVTVSDDPVTADGSPAMPTLSVPAAGAAVIVERPRDDIGVELVGGRRLRFARDTDPVTVRAMIDMLEGVA